MKSPATSLSMCKHKFQLDVVTVQFVVTLTHSLPAQFPIIQSDDNRIHSFPNLRFPYQCNDTPALPPTVDNQPLAQQSGTNKGHGYAFN